MKCFKIWMNQGIPRSPGKCVPIWPVMWPWLAAGNRNIRNCTKQSSPRVSSAPAFAKQTMAVCRRIFPPLPVSLPYFDASASPLESFFDSLQLSVSEYACFALQWPEIRPNLRGSFFFGSMPAGMLFTKRNENRAWPQVSFAGLDLRSGNTEKINELEKWCFEIIRTDLFILKSRCL